VEDEQIDMNVYFLIEDNLKGCPHIKLERNKKLMQWWIRRGSFLDIRRAF